MAATPAYSPFSMTARKAPGPQSMLAPGGGFGQGVGASMPATGPAPVAPTLAPFDPSKVAVDDPGAAWRLSQGTRALEHSAAARGTYFTPNTMRSLVDYNQNMAGQDYAGAFNRAQQAFTLNQNTAQQGYDNKRDAFVDDRNFTDTAMRDARDFADSTRRYEETLREDKARYDRAEERVLEATEAQRQRDALIEAQRRNEENDRLQAERNAQAAADQQMAQRAMMLQAEQEAERLRRPLSKGFTLARPTMGGRAVR